MSKMFLAYSLLDNLLSLCLPIIDPIPWNSSFVSFTVCDDSANVPTVSADLYTYNMRYLNGTAVVLGNGCQYFDKLWAYINYLSTVSANCREIEAKLSVALPLCVTRPSFSFCFCRFRIPSWSSVSFVNKSSLPLRSNSPMHLKDNKTNYNTF